MQEKIGAIPAKLDANSREHCALYHAVRNRLVNNFHRNIRIPDSADVAYSML